MLAVTINNDGLKKVVDKQDNPSVPIKDNPRVSVTLNWKITIEEA